MLPNTDNITLLQKQVIYLRNNGKVIKTLVYRERSESAALYKALSITHKYPNITSAVCAKIITY